MFSKIAYVLASLLTVYLVFGDLRNEYMCILTTNVRLNVTTMFREITNIVIRREIAWYLNTPRRSSQRDNLDVRDRLF